MAVSAQVVVVCPDGIDCDGLAKVVQSQLVRCREEVYMLNASFFSSKLSFSRTLHFMEHSASHLVYPVDRHRQLAGCD